MIVLMVACSRRAYDLMKSLEQRWKKRQPQVQIICKVKCSSLPKISESRSLTECVGEWFQKADAIVFLCAAGIAVRSIAPYIQHKSKDPAVVVVDETGKFSISLLSGHRGGANALAEQIGAMLGAIPVITTATDRECKFAVDDFARKNELILTDWKLAKQVAVCILEGQSVGLFSELPIRGKLPEELYFYKKQSVRRSSKAIAPMGATARTSKEKKIVIGISYHFPKIDLFCDVLQLIPQIVIIGIGCKKGTSEEKISYAVEQCLMQEKIMPEAVWAMASIDLKKEEKGILTYCEKREIPFLTYSAEELKRIEGRFTYSSFVKQITGVSNVCERSAVAASEGRLICNKKVYDGVTIALAEKKGSVRF